MRKFHSGIVKNQNGEGFTVLLIHFYIKSNQMERLLKIGDKVTNGKQTGIVHRTDYGLQRFHIKNDKYQKSMSGWTKVNPPLSCTRGHHITRQVGEETVCFYCNFIEDRFGECPECKGQGTYFEDTSSNCTKYRGDCCGGCGYDVDCENCEATGEIQIN